MVQTNSTLYFPLLCLCSHCSLCFKCLLLKIWPILHSIALPFWSFPGTGNNLTSLVLLCHMNIYMKTYMCSMWHINFIDFIGLKILWGQTLHLHLFLPLDPTENLIHNRYFKNVKMNSITWVMCKHRVALVHKLYLPVPNRSYGKTFYPL